MFNSIQVLGDKGNEAANVTGPSGEPVQGSPFAPDKRRPRSFQQHRRPKRSETGGDTTEGDGNAGGENDDDDKKPRQRRYRRVGGGGGGGAGGRFPQRGGNFRRGPRRNGEDQGMHTHTHTRAIALH